MTSTLIRGAHVLTMDDALGAIPQGDVLIEGDRIAAVGTGLDANGADVIDGTDTVCLPGFVDTHRHMWGAMLRGCACYGDLGQYFHDVVFTYGPLGWFAHSAWQSELLFWKLWVFEGAFRLALSFVLARAVMRLQGPASICACRSATSCSLASGLRM